MPTHDFSEYFISILNTFMADLAHSPKYAAGHSRNAQINQSGQEDFMRKGFLNTVGTTILPKALGALLAQACTSSTSAQSNDTADPIEGLWNSRVTITNCQSGAVMRQFQAMNLFMRGGTLADTDVQPPGAHGPAFGTWQNSGVSQYASVFQLFRYNPDGSFAGANKVTRTLTLSTDGNAFTSTIAVDVDDPTGVTISSACGTETGTRFR
jgi:hypothetical protein